MTSLNVCHTYFERSDLPECNHQIRKWLAQHYRCLIIQTPKLTASSPAGERRPGEHWALDSEDTVVWAAREQAEQTPRGYRKELLEEAALAHGRDAV